MTNASAPPIGKTHFSPVSLTQLGPRLQTVYDFVVFAQQQKYHDCIWDCCCDHGYLGIQLLNSAFCKMLYFVDQIPHLIEHLDSKLKQFPQGTYTAVHSDAGKLIFAPKQSHLIILAGIGGEHTVDILKSIGANHPHQQLDFIFCPSTTQYDLREYLVVQNFALIQESIVAEKGRQYEIIHARMNAADSSSEKITLTGEMWEYGNKEHLNYLTKVITHYQKRMRNDTSGRAKKIGQKYRAVMRELTEEPF